MDIDERLIDRAVEIWKRLLRNPKYDNVGDTGSIGDKKRGQITSLLAHTLPNNVTEERLELFGKALEKQLLSKDENIYDRFYMHVDYGPNKILELSAEESGLVMEWPWKTMVRILENMIYVTSGYGAEATYHYPLSNKRWLVANLSGSDISKVIDYVTGGEPNFTIEEEG